MIDTHFKQMLTYIRRLWADEEFDRALLKVEELREEWPGNAHLHFLWASLVQLQEESPHSLADVERALKTAAELEPESPAAAIELAQFLDTVEDDPQAASKVYAKGIRQARHSLMEGLLRQAKVFVQLQRFADASRYLMELVYLNNSDRSSRREQMTPGGAAGVNGSFAQEIEALLHEVLANRSA